MSKIAKSLTDLIGHTPLLELKNYNTALGLHSTILAKLEMFNPLSSVKDRVGYGLIVDAEEKGLIDQETVLVEPTSGNTGIGLAFAAACRGYRLILTMPENMSAERRSLLAALGAELVLTPKEEGMSGAIEKANALLKELPKAHLMGQFDNPANPAVHRKTTAQEILSDLDGKLDAFVAGVGTGGALTGIGEVLKEKIPGVKIIAMEPANSPFLSEGRAGSHNLQGIGAGFIPKVLNTTVYDEIITVKEEDAYNTCRLAAKKEGLLIGISSGAALYAATQLAQRPELEGKTILVLLPDTGERYLSTGLFDPPASLPV